MLPTYQFTAVFEVPATVAVNCCVCVKFIAPLRGVSVTVIPPTPVNATLCDALGALSVKVNDPVRVPVVVGLKLTFTVQLRPIARLAGQLFVCRKSPVTPMLLIRSGCDPGLLRTTA